MGHSYGSGLVSELLRREGSLCFRVCLSLSTYTNVTAEETEAWSKGRGSPKTQGGGGRGSCLAPWVTERLARSRRISERGADAFMEHLLYTRKASIWLHRGQNRTHYRWGWGVTLSCSVGEGACSWGSCGGGENQFCRLPSAFHLNPTPNRTIKLSGYQPGTSSKGTAARRTAGPWLS